MKRDHINYFAVGLFVLLALALLLVVMFRITGRSANVDTYYVELKNVSGIRNGSPVSYAGYQIGQIAAIAPVRDTQGTRYRLELVLNKGWSIPADSTAQIVTPGLLAEKQVDISEGSSVDMLKPGARIGSIEAADMFQLVSDVSAEFRKLSDQGLKPLFDTLNREITQTVPAMTQQTTSLLTQLNASAARLLKLMETMDDKRVNAIVGNTETVTTNLLDVSQKLTQSAGKIDSILSNTSTMVGENGHDLRQAILDLRASMGVVAENINSIVYHIDSTSRNMNEFTRQLRDNPAVILNSKPPVDAAQ